MFRKSIEEQVLKEADKIVSLKEDIDSMSWSRVVEIAKLLQVEHTDEQRFEWARELLSISHANLSVLGKFGVPAEGMTGTMIASGIEFIEGDRYLIKNSSETMLSEDPALVAAQAVSDATTMNSLPYGEAFPAVDTPAVADVEEAVNELAPIGGAIPLDESAPVSAPVDALVVDGTILLEESSVAEGVIATGEAAESVVLLVQEENPERGKVKKNSKKKYKKERDKATGKKASAAPETNLTDFEPVSFDAKSVMDDLFGKASIDIDSAAVQPTFVVSEATELDQGGIATMRQSGDKSAGRGCIDAETAHGSDVRADEKFNSGKCQESAAMSMQDLTRFKQLYASRDGNLCLYEDADGHLVAVDPARFA